MRPNLKDFDSLADYMTALYDYINKLEERNEKFLSTIDVTSDTLYDCVNELCLHCGKYKEEHLGACEGCKWKGYKTND